MWTPAAAAEDDTETILYRQLFVHVACAVLYRRVMRSAECVSRWQCNCKSRRTDTKSLRISYSRTLYRTYTSRYGLVLSEVVPTLELYSGLLVDFTLPAG